MPAGSPQALNNGSASPSLRHGRKAKAAGMQISTGGQEFQSENGMDGVLGCSSLGTVVRTRLLQSDEVHALRQINKHKLHGQEWKSEVDLLRQLDHPHICKIVDTWEDSMSLYMAMELCQGGNLTELGNSQDKFNEGVIAVLMEQMVSAVSDLHAHQVVHTDLRPENWLFKEPLSPESSTMEMQLKMIDFGIACKHGKKGRRSRADPPALRPSSSSTSTCSRSIPEPLSAAQLAQEAQGEGFAPLRQLFCAAPEQVSRSGPAFGQPLGAGDPGGAEEIAAANRAAGEKADVWALGVIAYFLLSGQSPFPLAAAMADNDLSFKNARFVFMPTGLWRPVSSQAKNFIVLCLQKDPLVRPTAKQLRALPWMQLAKAILSREAEGVGEQSEAQPWRGGLNFEDPPLPTAQAVLQSFDRMRQLQRIERAAIIATAFWIPSENLNLLFKALEVRDPGKSGWLPLQELLYVLLSLDVPCADLAKWSRESGANTCQIAYCEFVDDVREFQWNTQESALWEVYSHFDESGAARVPKRLLGKALGEDEYHSVAAKFPQLPLDRVLKEFEHDGQVALGFLEFRQALSEASQLGGRKLIK